MILKNDKKEETTKSTTKKEKKQKGGSKISKEKSEVTLERNPGLSLASKTRTKTKVNTLI